MVDAVDVCFKVFHVLGLKYPTANEHIWLLIQKCIYKFATKWDNIIPRIEYILKQFENKIEPTPSTSSSSQC